MTHEELEKRIRALERANEDRLAERLRHWLADKLMPWAAGNATVWPSYADAHAGLLEEQAELHQANEDLNKRIVELTTENERLKRPELREQHDLADGQEATRLRTVIKHVIEADNARSFLPEEMRAYLVGHTSSPQRRR